MSGFSSGVILPNVGATGSPTTGSHAKNELWTDSVGVLWICTGGGSPGTWVQVGSASQAGAVALSTVTTAGDLIIATGNAAVTRIAAPASGLVLTGNGVGVAPTWQAASGGAALLGVTSYAPAGAASLTVASATLATLDTTNAIVNFTTTASGKGSTQVLIRLTAWSAQSSNLLIGFLNHSGGAQVGPAGTADGNGFGNAGEYVFLVSSLTANTAYQFDLAAAGPTAASVPVFVARNATAASMNAGPLVIEAWAA